MVSYVDAFWLLFGLTLVIIPLLAIMRGLKPQAGAAPSIHMDSAMRTLLPVVASLKLAECTVGPDFQRPSSPSASTYVAGASSLAPTGTSVIPSPISALVPRSDGGPPSAHPSSTTWWSGRRRTTTTLAASNATLAAAREELRVIAGRGAPQIDASARVDRQQVNLAAYGFDGAGALGSAGNPEFCRS